MPLFQYSNIFCDEHHIYFSAPSKDLPKVLVKFSYKANPDRPGGFDELTIKQGEKLYFHHPHKSNPHWVLAENMDGESGYVPASYLMVSLLFIDSQSNYN